MRLLVVLFSLLFYSGGFAKMDTEWWKHTILYEIIPYTFKDSNGDGIGDLKGITSQLDHLVDLRIETIHLTPTFKTSFRDMGYDISDYYDIEPKIGTMSDFDELIKEMKKRDMKLILDLVINHSGYKNEWFQKSVDKIDPYTNFYVWKDSKGFDNETQRQIPPNQWRSIFTFAISGSGWTWNEKRGQFYFHQFLPEQPDLNLSNEILKEELKKMIKFWLDKGVAGFRLDAVLFYFEDKEFRDGWYVDRQLNQPETLEFIHEFRLFLDEYNKRHGGFERIFIAEAHASFDNDMVVQFYGRQDYPITHFPYNFMFEDGDELTNAITIQSDIKSWMDSLPIKEGVSLWMTQDHDLTRIGSRIIPEYCDIFTMLTMMLPGSVGVYYGQEICMEDGFITEGQMKDFSEMGRRDPARLLMQWDDTINAGFSKNISTFLPTNSDYFKKNVKIQKAKDVSHYNMFKDLSTMRQTDTFKYGEFEQFSLSDYVYVFARYHENHLLMVVINLDKVISRINLNETLRNPPNRIVIAAASVNAGYSTGFTLEPEFENEFYLRPLSAILFETIHSSFNGPYNQNNTIPTSAASPTLW